MVSMDHPVYETFPQRLESIRKFHGLRKYQLAEKSGFSSTAIIKFTTGKRTPLLHTLVRMSQVFDVPVDFLLGLEERADGRHACEVCLGLKTLVTKQGHPIMGTRCPDCDGRGWVNRPVSDESWLKSYYANRGEPCRFGKESDV